MSPADDAHTPEPAPTDHVTDQVADPAQAAQQRFLKALERLEKAKPFAKSHYHAPFLQTVDALLDTQQGLELLWEHAPRYGPAGVFVGGPWENPARLLPPLVRGSLKAPGVVPLVETLSELRLLAVATDRCDKVPVEQDDARGFLEEALALNLDLLFPVASEESRTWSEKARERAHRILTLVSTHLSQENLRRKVTEEIELICHQRPILTRRVVAMIRHVVNLPAPGEGEPDNLRRYVEALDSPSPLSKVHPDYRDYRQAIREASPATLQTEAEACAASLRGTGLSSPHHAVLLRRLRTVQPDLVAVALGLDPVGQASFDKNRTLALQLIRVAILPSTAQAVYGLARLLDRALLSRSAVAAGLRRLVDIDLCSRVRRDLLTKRGPRDGTTANTILLAGVMAVLGQPLGIGQGANPTCQAARGISLWSTHAPGYLLELLASAARDDTVQMRFEDTLISSKDLHGGLAATVDLELDPVSIVLVPHLDRIYDEIMSRVAVRDQDGHKWVNPALYGRWVPHGFASGIDKLTGAVTDFPDFVRRFYATHHPAFNDGYEMIYPNPVGIMVTTTHGDLLGLHAVSLLRIKEDESGTLRAYFYNPNDEGRQDWGQGIRPSVYGHGELEGECSLPFFQFASRLYAFHYNPFEEGDAFAVPQEVIDTVDRLAKESWGKSYPWY